jgi:hypothetical protein
LLSRVEENIGQFNLEGKYGKGQRKDMEKAGEKKSLPCDKKT